MQKKELILFITIVALITSLSLGFFIYRNYKKNPNLKGEQGTIHIPPIQTMEEYDTYEEDLLYEPKSHVVIENAELIYDLFTLEALKNILPAISTYLDHHGYSEVTNLIIQKDTIINDRGYPYFICDMNGVEDKELEIRYHLETMEFEIQILER